MEEHAALRRKDTTKGPPLRILSLDGGGVRGYSMLIILQELMHRTYVEIHGEAPTRGQIPKPCEHFDLISGTGTGGLIAIMLGRLRLDIDTCKDVYVRMTKKVFETDKTFAGIPYRGTLFKASKLEDAIRECVAQHTVDQAEGNDKLATATPMNTDTLGFDRSSTIDPQRAASTASRYSQIGSSPVVSRSSASRWGDPNTLLYDVREHRTKTAVTAVYKNTPPGGSSAVLRSYDSRKEPASDVNCTIWQAGRATCATGLAFKPIQVGQSVYIDEGSGKYNPAPQMLDEAVINEWPGREVGVFVSIGTGKRPGGTNSTQHLWWESFVGGAMGDFAEARKRLINKIEGCEETHQYMLRDHLYKRGVNPQNYYRLNVEVGVGDFGMNEWHRLSDISTSTRMYLARPEVTKINNDAAAKLAKVELSKRRPHRHESQGSIQSGDERYMGQHPAYDVPPPSNPLAVELPAEDVPAGSYYGHGSASRPFRPTPSVANMKYSVISSDEYPQPVESPLTLQQSSYSQRLPFRPSIDSSRRSDGSVNRAPSLTSSTSLQQQQTSPTTRATPPPLPPKTPLPYPDLAAPQSPRTFTNMGALDKSPSRGGSLPYPDTDGPPPVVNLARKPEYGVR